MKIELTPEDERVVRQRLRDGTFQSAEEVIHDALASQEAEAAWFRENQDAVDAKIRRGIEQLERGEGVPGDIARARLQQRKHDWQAEHRRK